MREKNILPDKRHYAMAMFACVTSNQCSLAESVFTLAIRMHIKPDVVLYTLFLRALLQQEKWSDGMQLLGKMLTSTDTNAKPNVQTLNYLLLYQITSNKYHEAIKTLELILLFQKQPLSSIQKEKKSLAEYSSSSDSSNNNDDSEDNDASSSNSSGSIADHTFLHRESPLLPSGAGMSGNMGPSAMSSGSSSILSKNPQFGELYILGRKLIVRNKRSVLAIQGGHAPSLAR